MSAEEEREHSEETEYHPCCRNHEKSISAVKVVACLPAQHPEHDAATGGEQYGYHERNAVVFPIYKRHHQACHHKSRFKKKQLADYPRNNLKVYHSVWCLKYFSTLLRLCSWQNTITESPASI